MGHGGVRPQMYPSNVFPELKAWLVARGITPAIWNASDDAKLLEWRKQFYAWSKMHAGEPKGFTASGAGPPAKAPAPTTSHSAWPSNVTSVKGLAEWLKGRGITPQMWWGDGPDGIKTNEERAQLRALFYASHTPGAGALGDLAGSLSLGAEGLTQEPFLEFVPPTFLPSTDQFANSTMDAWAREVLGRRLRPEERARAIAAWRSNERAAYESETRKLRAEHARGILQQTEAFPGGDIPVGESGGMVPSSGQVAEARQRAESFQQFTEADFEIQVREAIAMLSPTEEFGVEVREAMDGFYKAVQGRVQQERFMP